MKCDAESALLVTTKGELLQKLQRVDDDDLKCTNHILDYKHPQTEVARAQQVQALECVGNKKIHTKNISY